MDNTKGDNLLAGQVSIHTRPRALTPQGCFASSVSHTHPGSIDLPALRWLTDISKGIAAQEELPGEEVLGTAGCVRRVAQHRGSCQ